MEPVALEQAMVSRSLRCVNVSATVSLVDASFCRFHPAELAQSRIGLHTALGGVVPVNRIDAVPADSAQLTTVKPPGGPNFCSTNGPQIDVDTVPGVATGTVVVVVVVVAVVSVVVVATGSLVVAVSPSISAGKPSSWKIGVSVSPQQQQNDAPKVIAPRGRTNFTRPPADGGSSRQRHPATPWTLNPQRPDRPCPATLRARRS